MPLLRLPILHQITWIHTWIWLRCTSSRNQKNTFFCSSRGMNHGCSRTFSILYSNRLRNSPTHLASIVKLLSAYAQGSSVHQAFNTTRLSFSITSAYRFVKRWKQSISHIRRWLDFKPPPQSTLSATPEIRTWNLLIKWSDQAHCAGSLFQLSFQQSLLI